MSNKQLEDKAMDLKGKKYVMVKDRLGYFNETYPKGSITTELSNVLNEDSGTPTYVVRAEVNTGVEDSQSFSGLSQATMGGKGADKTAALENAETSAVGRALAFMGIGVVDSIASSDEMIKAGAATEQDFI